MFFQTYQIHEACIKNNNGRTDCERAKSTTAELTVLPSEDSKKKANLRLDKIDALSKAMEDTLEDIKEIAKESSKTKDDFETDKAF